MTSQISLAEWIAELRAELTEAIAWQSERTRTADEHGRALAVPPLKLNELKLEVEVRSSRETGGKGGVKFWVVSADGEQKSSAGTTHRVTLLLSPTIDVHLGDDKGFVPE